MSTEIIQVLVGGGIAIFSSLITVLTTNLIATKQKRDSLTQAFLGEIQAICELLRRREYATYLRGIATYIRENEEPIYKVLKAELEYLNIYRANASDIGLLSSDLPYKISGFYLYATALLEDAHSISTGYLHDIPPHELASFYDEMSEIVYEVLRRGDEIIQHKV